MLGGPQPDETLDLLQTLPNCWLILGNNEDYLLRLADGSAPASWWTSRQRAFTRWSYLNLSPQHLAFLSSLPEQCVVEGQVRLVHGSPSSVGEYFMPESHPERFAAAMAATSEPVVVFGHTHIAWQVRQDGRLAFNPGSAGVPMQPGDPRPQYTLLERRNGGWHLEPRRVAYDLDLIRQAYRRSGLLEYGTGFTRAYLYDILHGTDLVTAFVRFTFDYAARAGLPQESDFIPDELWDAACSAFSWPEGA
jgi:diadenosine tetraphosphatase ApaH/serine/threonine PP2A family protein phosphatase